MKQKTIIEDWYCKKCGEIFPIEIEADETTTKVWCPKCHKRMFRVKLKGVKFAQKGGKVKRK